MAKKLTAKVIQARIDEAILEEHKAKPIRRYLGMSGIGEPCARKPWLQWRWCYIEKHSARLLRLFERGHLEEERFVNWLRSAGFPVSDIDPTTGKQYEFTAQKGYIQGHSDGIAMIIGEWLAEMKTMNNKNFNATKRANNIEVSKPTYYGQMQRYMHAKKLKFGLFMAINKDNDAMHLEVIKYDKSKVQWLLEREKDLVWRKTPPPGIADSEGFYLCNFCSFKPNCFDGIPPLKTCRMCEHIRLPGKGKWFCGRKKKHIELTLNQQQQGCKHIKLISIN